MSISEKSGDRGTVGWTLFLAGLEKYRQATMTASPDSVMLGSWEFLCQFPEKVAEDILQLAQYIPVINMNPSMLSGFISSCMDIVNSVALAGKEMNAKGPDDWWSLVFRLALIGHAAEVHTKIAHGMVYRLCENIVGGQRPDAGEREKEVAQNAMGQLKSLVECRFLQEGDLSKACGEPAENVKVRIADALRDVSSQGLDQTHS